MASVDLALLDPDDEHSLIARARQGDEGAWQRLVDSFSPILRGTIRARLGLDDTDEALQNTWLRVWKALSTYDPARAPFIAFCRWHAKNAAIDLLRRNRGRRFEISSEDLGGPEGDRDPYDWLAQSATGSGANPAADVEDDIPPQWRESIYAQFLHLTFSLPSPPHELMCYGFNQLLGWKPRNIVSDLGPDWMKAVETRLESEMEEKSGLETATIERCFSTLRGRLPSRLKDLVADSRTQRRYDGLLDRVVAGTALREYFSNDPGADIAAWWWGVQRRIVSEARLLRTPEIDRMLERLS